MLKWRGVASLTSAALVWSLAISGSGGAASGVAAATRAIPAPQHDPFYRAPAHLTRLPPGAIIRTRQVHLTVMALPAAVDARAFQVIYRTTDTRRRPIANAATVIVPSGTAPAHGRDLVALQDAENSDSETCAPSYQLRVAGPNGGLVDMELTAVSSELTAGRDVVVPDALGPRSEFLARGLEGRSSLDAIRAVERFRPAQLAGRKTRIGLIGYSEGSHQAVSAAELAPTYAPRLRIIGVAAGGVPTGDAESMRWLAKSDPANVLQIMTGLNRAFPLLRWRKLLTPAGRSASRQMSTCDLVLLIAGPSGPLSKWTKPHDVFTVPRVARVLRANVLGRVVPTAPLFLFIGANDEEISKASLDRLVAHDCAAGARLDYDVDSGGQEHIESFVRFESPAVSYLDDRFAGKKAPTTCPA